MCGIVGLSFSTTKHFLSKVKADTARELFTHMLLEAQSRGSAASGIYVVKSMGNVSRKYTINTFKSPLSAKQLVNSEAYKKIIGLIDENTYHIVGHTRAVTGNAPATNNRNNHPHQVGKFIGVHNGVIKNNNNIWKALSKFGYAPTGACDSEALFALLDHAYTNALSKAVGKPNQTDKHNALMAACRFASEKLDGWYSAVFTNFDHPSRVCILKDGGYAEMDMLQFNDYGMVGFASTMDTIEKAMKKVMKFSTKDWLLPPGETTMLNSEVEYQANNLTVEYAKTKDVLVTGKNELSAEDKERLAVTRGLL
jgi:glucosamine 6-phosphate synthetase-like amidotransferase/phosphosugar isomerase protein